ncbi:antitoxin VapB family protein [Salinirubellus sp. GCM10025818]|uniref:antitoxin VapB family protein n=1 Tax=Salinirubellus TaxID=2162630 RepID=UPI0030D556B9
MVKTIRVSEEYYAWLCAHKRDDETMEETLHRLIRGPNPEDVAGLLTSEEADEAKEAVKDLRDRDGSCFEAVREAFDGEGADG